MATKTQRRYSIISDDLKKDIYSGNLNPGQQLPTVKQLAKNYGVAIATVSRAINKLKEDGLLNTTIGGGCFVSKNINSIKRRSRNIITLVSVYSKGNSHIDGNLLNYWNQLFSPFLIKIQENSQFFNFINHNISVPEILLSTPNELKKYLNNQGATIEGAICHWPAATEPMANQIAEALDFPVVFADTICSVSEMSSINCVTLDTYLSATKALKHLIQLGHKRIGCISASQDNPFFCKRLQAYQDIMADFELPLNQYLYFSDDNLSDITKTCCKLLDDLEKTHLTAVFCFNDYRAWVLLNEARKRKISIPEQLAIVGFDGHKIAFLESITTVDISPAHMSIESLTLLHSLLDGIIYPNVQFRISGGLIKGKTT